MLFTASDFTSITSHIHNWVLFLLWFHFFILSWVISPLISNSILGTYRPMEFLFQCPIICLFILFMGFSRQEYWSGLPFPSPVDHFLLELSTMTSPSWVALHGMAHSFIELGKAVVHVISLISFLWLWFSFCLPSDGEGKRLMETNEIPMNDFYQLIKFTPLHLSAWTFEIPKYIHRFSLLKQDINPLKHNYKRAAHGKGHWKILVDILKTKIQVV